MNIADEDLKEKAQQTIKGLDLGSKTFYTISRFACWKRLRTKSI